MTDSKGNDEELVPEEHASEESGTGGADSPEEVIGVDQDVAETEKDPDAGESKPDEGP
jgi:hypothetical protein